MKSRLTRVVVASLVVAAVSMGSYALMPDQARAVTTSYLYQQVQAIKSTIASLKKTDSSLSSSISGVKTRMSAAESTLKSLGARTASLESSTSMLTSQTQLIALRQDQHENRLTSHEASLQAVDDAVFNLQVKDASTTSDIESLTVAARKSQDIGAALEASHSALSTRVADAEGSVATMEGLIAGLQTAQDSIVDHLSTIDAALRSQEESGSLLYGLIQGLSTRVDELASQMTSAQNTDAAQAARLSALEAEVAALKSTTAKTPFSVMVGGSFDTTSVPFVNTWRSGPLSSNNWTTIQGVGYSSMFANYSYNYIADLRVLVLDSAGQKYAELPYAEANNATGFNSGYTQCEVRVPPGGSILVQLTRNGSGSNGNRLEFTFTGYQSTNGF